MALALALPVAIPFLACVAVLVWRRASVYRGKSVRPFSIADRAFVDAHACELCGRWLTPKTTSRASIGVCIFCRAEGK